MQDKEPIAFYSRKLNKAQKRYTTTESNSVLVIKIEACKEYKNIFNPSNLILRCFLTLEEYGVTFEYLPGKKQKNAVVNSLSRLDIDSLKIQEEKALKLI
jgi:hypothetical protein